MTSKLDTAYSRGDRARARAYAREFALGMVAYVVVIAAAIVWGDLNGPGWQRYVWALLPLLPTLWLVVVVWRHVQRVDEYQRQLLLRQLAASFAAMVGISVALGLLSFAGLDMTLAPWIIYGTGMLTWAVAALIDSRGSR
jgi:hypothetical protein